MAAGPLDPNCHRYKNELQELLQGHQLQFPVYKTLGSAEQWTCTLTLRWRNGQDLMEKVEWRGRKKEAEQEAAKKMLQQIRNIEGGRQDQVWLVKIT